ncbi:unnamed protein product [Prunus armeniaca]
MDIQSERGQVIKKKLGDSGAGLGDSHPMGIGTGILRNLLNGDGIEDEGGDGIAYTAPTRPVAIPMHT